MTDAMTAMTGKWWRFDGYQIRNDAVRPADGASLEPYDPWDDYQRARLHRAEPPYQALLALLDHLPPSPDAALSAAERTALVNWCAKNGLLGRLPHRAQLLALAPR